MPLIEEIIEPEEPKLRENKKVNETKKEEKVCEPVVKSEEMLIEDVTTSSTSNGDENKEITMIG